MSYNVSLYYADDRDCVVPSHQEGAIIVVGGSANADMNVTYNYSKYFYQYLPDGLRGLHGERAGDTIEALRTAVNELGTKRANDYWAATPGNAGYTLNVMLRWAEMHPDAIWNVS